MIKCYLSLFTLALSFSVFSTHGMLHEPKVVKTGMKQAITHIEFSPNSQLVLARNKKGESRALSFGFRKPTKRIAKSYDLHMMPDNTLAQIYEENQQWQLFDHKTNRQLNVLQNPQFTWMKKIKLSTDGKRALGYSQTHLYIWNLSTKEIIRSEKLQDKPKNLIIACSPDCTSFVIYNKNTKMVRLATKKTFGKYFKINHDIALLEFSADGSYLYALTKDQNYENLLLKITLEEQLVSKVIYNDKFLTTLTTRDNLLATVNYLDNITVQNMNSKNSLGTIECPDEISSIAISPDKKYVAAGTKSRKIYIWEIRNPNL